MQHLLEHFKDLTLHPKNAQELKGLFLKLAVQGKLTAQWRKDNPEAERASDLLKRIEAKKKELVKAKKIRKEKELLPIGQGEIPFVIPQSWVWSKLGEISLIVGGGTPKSSNPEFFCEDGISWFTPADLGKSKSKYVEKGRRDLTEIGLRSSSAQIMPAGSVLFSSRAPIGHTAIGTKEFCTNQGFKSAAPYVIEMNEYIYYYLNSIVKEANENASGTTFKEVSGEIVKNFLFPLPPLEEQKAIVATVNQLFAEVELLEAETKKRIQLKEDFVSSALRRLSTEDTASAWGYLQPHFKTFFTEKSSIKKLRESILQLAVQGKLTRDFRKTHPDLCEGTHSAKALLERIKAERAKLIKEGKLKKEKLLPAITEDEIPYELPDGWVWCRLGEIIKISSGNGLTSANMDKTGNVPVYGGNGITGYHNVGNIKERTIVIGRVGYYCGSIHLTEEIAWITDNAFITNFSKPNIDRDFLVWLLKITNLKEDENATAQPVISGRKVYPIIVSIPPLSEQKAIVYKVNSLMALCDRLEKEIETQKTTQEEWMQSCLREVVVGKEKQVIG